MPELPEVEALVGFLREQAVGRAVQDVEVGAVNALKTVSPPPEALVGRTVVAVSRHGKWLDVRTGPAGSPAVPPDGSGDGSSGTTGHDALHLVVHLARAGWLRWSDALPTTRPLSPGRGHVALRVRLAGGAGFDLTEAGSRRRLAVHVVRDPAEVDAVASLGVDPLSPELTAQRLAELCATRNQQVKKMLRDQSVLAGIGNAYSDEILHAAHESPFALTGTFEAERVARLHRAIGTVLGGAVAAAAGRPASDIKDAKRAVMRVHGRAGLPCPVCGDEIREVSFADSFLDYCPTCQTGGKLLADRRMSRLLR